jgi:hypothetical protein
MRHGKPRKNTCQGKKTKKSRRLQAIMDTNGHPQDGAWPRQVSDKESHSMGEI